MRIVVSFILLSLLIQGCKHEPEEKSIDNFSKSYGGLGDDVAENMIRIDEFIYMIGTTRSFGNSNGSIYWVKTDLDGNKIGEKIIGESGYWNGNSITALADGNMIVGATYSTDGSAYNLAIYKMNTAGDILNVKNIDEPSHMSIDDVYETKDNRLMLIGADNRAGHRQISLITLSSSLDFLSQKLFGRSGVDGGSRILEQTDGDFMLYGYGTIPGNPSQDLYLMRLNADQDSLWGKYYGGDDYEEPQQFLQTSDNDFLLVGHSASTDPIHNMYIVKVNADGDIIWEREFGGAAHDGAEAALINSKGQYVFVARSMSFGGNQNAYMVVTDKNGNMIEDLVIGGDGMDRFNDMVEYENYYYLAGHTSSFGNGALDFYLEKMQVK
ncbi:hypothetical protein [Crocinitomix catalasitica]|uniref:hypothetical protein n=1 Tax=Crocinitomix catalasitica TaxID=184607 RepID=UPI0004844CDC|nr:hypothetical protein [Crocinitomix catalasitica]